MHSNMRRQMHTKKANTIAISNIGKVRQHNEDCIFVNNDKSCGVSDGMGGLPRGKEAAEEVGEYMEDEEWQERFYLLDDMTNSEEVKGYLSETIENINKKIAIKNYSWCFRYGCTICGVYIKKNQAFFYNIGDSRGYIYHKEAETLQQVTKDHSQYQYLLDQNKIDGMSPKEVMRSQCCLRRFIGKDDKDKPDLFVENICAGDIILITTDGLVNELTDGDLTTIIKSKKNLSEKGEILLENALEHGGHDNISFILYEVL